MGIVEIKKAIYHEWRSYFLDTKKPSHSHEKAYKLI